MASGGVEASMWISTSFYFSLLFFVLFKFFFVLLSYEEGKYSIAALSVSYSVWGKANKHCIQSI